MRIRVLQGFSGIFLACGLLLAQTPWRAGADGATLFTSHRYGYTIVVPAGWEVTRGDCVATQQFTAPDQASLLHIAVAPGPSTAAGIRAAEQQAVAPYGRPSGTESFSRWAINGRGFEVLAGTVRTSGGLGVVVRVAAAAVGGMLYTVTGAAYPFNADHGRGVLQGIVGAIRSIHIGGKRDASGCGATHPAATPAPTRAPASTGGGDFTVVVYITPSPVPRGGKATAAVQTIPYASCTAALAYDNIPNPLGALFGVSPQNTDGYGRTIWSWTLDYAVTGGTVTVTCNYRGVTKSGAAHFRVK